MLQKTFFCNIIQFSPEHSDHIITLSTRNNFTDKMKN